MKTTISHKELIVHNLLHGDYIYMNSLFSRPIFDFESMQNTVILERLRNEAQNVHF